MNFPGSNNVGALSLQRSLNVAPAGENHLAQTFTENDMQFDQCIDRFAKLSIKADIMPLRIGTKCTSQRFEIHLAWSMRQRFA